MQQAHQVVATYQDEPETDNGYEMMLQLYAAFKKTATAVHGLGTLFEDAEEFSKMPALAFDALQISREKARAQLEEQQRVKAESKLQRERAERAAVQEQSHAISSSEASTCCSLWCCCYQSSSDPESPPLTSTRKDSKKPLLQAQSSTAEPPDSMDPAVHTPVVAMPPQEMTRDTGRVVSEIV